MRITEAIIRNDRQIVLDLECALDSVSRDDIRQREHIERDLATARSRLSRHESQYAADMRTPR